MKLLKHALIAAAIPFVLCSCQSAVDQDGPPPPPPVPAQPHRIAVFQLGGGQDVEDIPISFLKQGLKLFQFTEGTYYTLNVIDLKGDLEAFPKALAEAMSKGVDLVGVTHPKLLQAAMKSDVSKPMVFSVLGDPLVLGAGDSVERHKPGVTGSYHALPSQTLLTTIKYYLPAVKRVGVIFNGQSPISIAHKDALIRDASSTELELVPADSAGGKDLAPAADSLLNQKVDAISLVIGLDANTENVITKARDSKIPVFGLTEEQVKQGALAAEVPSLDRVGVEAGRMIYRVLSGEDPSSIPLAPLIDIEAVVSLKVADTLGITVPVGALRISRSLD